MKKLFALSVCFLSCALLSFGQADKVVGIWLTADGDSQVRIFKATNGKYYGKIEWLDEPYEEDGSPKVDDENPVPELQDKPLLGLRILNGFEYDAEEKEWENGTIYDPENGKTYDCYMWFEDDPDVLQIKGFVLGMRFLGRETIWTRESKIRELPEENPD